MWGKQFVFWGALMLVVPAFSAGPSCAEIFRNKKEEDQNNPKTIIVQAVNDNSLQKHLLYVAAEINSSRGWINTPEIDLEIANRPVDVSFFNPMLGLISMGHGLNGRSPFMRDVIFSHEYSHAIFLENFKISWNGQQITLKELIQMARMEVQDFSEAPHLRSLEQNVQELEATLQLAKQAKNLRVAAQLKQLLADAVAERAPYQQAMDLFEQLHDMLMSYNELFADSLPVLLRQDPHAMTTALYKGKEDGLEAVRDMLVNRNNNMDAPAPRDFVMTSIEGWKHELNDTYTLLDPSRGVLWELYMKDLPREKIPVFIKTFLETVSAHLAARQGRGESLDPSVKKVDPAALNREFLRIFAARAVANHLVN